MALPCSATPATGRVFALANHKSGHVVQRQVVDAGGRLSLTFARSWQLGSQPEGMVSDDAGGAIFVGEEDVGIWRLTADPAARATAAMVDAIPSSCLPRDDVEGLAVWDNGTRRYLVASARGIHRAAIHDLGAAGTPCRGLVGGAAGPEVDGVTETGGLDVTAAALPGYPAGLPVLMDDQNAGFASNFKPICWQDIAKPLALGEPGR